QGVILNVKIWTAKIDFLARVHPFRRESGPKFLPPEIRRRDIDFVAWSPRQTRSLRLVDVRRRSLLRIEISVSGRQNQLGDRRRVHFEFNSLGPSRPEIEGVKKSVKANHVGQIVVEIGRSNTYAISP